MGERKKMDIGSKEYKLVILGNRRLMNILNLIYVNI